MCEPNRQRAEQGVVLVAILTVLVPLILLVGAYASSMLGHNSALRAELDYEVALLAAEAGVDEAIHQGRTGALKHGVRIDRDLGWGQRFSVEPSYLGSDLKDNDGDGAVDEPDEDVFQIVVDGTYRESTRRLAAYLGPVPLLPPIDGAFVTQDPGIAISLGGTSLVSGNDVNVDGSPGPGPNVPGIAIAPPGTVAHLDSELTPAEELRVEGFGGTPSLGLGAAVDVATLVGQLQNIANLVLTANRYSSFSFGDASARTTNITYRNGNVRFAGNTRGAGILVVTGDLRILGNFRFDGVIVVLGRLTASAGTADVYGSIIQGDGGSILDASGTLEIHYSSEAVQLANSGSGNYVSFNGWQELATP